MQLSIALLRGVCQIPAYVALQNGLFQDEGLDVSIRIQPTAWLIPAQLAAGKTQFAMLPWTRSAASELSADPLVVLAGSGYEEAAIVGRNGVSLPDVKSIAVPREGGMKDLTAQGLLESLGWSGIDQIRQPSGDGAILAFVGQGVDAASMIEPYATMIETLGLGRIVRRTGDIWPGVPGCCLSTSRRFLESQPDVAERVVRAFARGAQIVETNPDEAAQAAYRYIGIAPSTIRAALEANKPRLNGIRNTAAMERVLHLMKSLGYLDKIPTRFVETKLLDRVQASLASAAATV
jgi:NitT/TauT family transport system substrate-binding protein